MKITNIYAQQLPAVRFIGKRYTNDDRVGGGFGAKWGEFFANGYFDKIEKAISPLADYEDNDAYLGLMMGDENSFEYWIGMFAPAGTDVPEGFGYVDYDATRYGICWLKGKEGEVYGHEDECVKALGEKGYKVTRPNGRWLMFERYGCPRFTTPDENGEIILDIGISIE